MVGQGRLELPTSRLSGARSNQLSYWPWKSVMRARCGGGHTTGLRWSGGAEEIRTPDILLAKQALYQLSYSPAGFHGGTGAVADSMPNKPKWSKNNL
jgi:hypothetical protein